MAPTLSVPRTPGVTSPTASDDTLSRDNYFGPVTRSAARTRSSRVTSPEPTELSGSASERSETPTRRTRKRGFGSLTAQGAKLEVNGGTNGHLTVPTLPAQREISRSPSPLGLIPIHSQFRSFIHRHEIPRKILHVSIGFITVALYANGYETSDIHPVLLSALIPVASADILRHNFPSLNRIYIKALGALMRESEVQGYNGVIWYLAGTWAVLRFLPKDLGVMGVLLLSWCDPAASTFGRLWGRRTWRLRRGKSVAGSAAALVVGVLTAWGFWGFLVPRYDTTNRSAYAFQGVLKLSNVARETLGWHDSKTVVEGPLALGILSLVAGAVASASEAIDLFNWDDNFTIPVLCGIGLWGFLKVFGNA